MRAEDVGLTPLEEERLPDHPPEPRLLYAHPDPGVRRSFYEQWRLVAHLSSPLLASAYRLTELAERYEGRYREGMAISDSCRAAATGAIAVSCAAIEACLNEFLLVAESLELAGQALTSARLLRVSTSLSVDKRLEAITAVCGEVVDWGAEPYQSVSLLLSVRKHALHHEGQLSPANQGFWPAKKLKEVARRIGSPYPFDREIPLDWHEHILTPAGARWAVETAWQILTRLEDLQRRFESDAGLLHEDHDASAADSGSSD